MDIKISQNVDAESLEDGSGVAVRWLWSAVQSLSGFTVVLFEIPAGTATPQFDDPFERAIYVLTGEGRLQAESQECQLLPDVTIMILPHELHHITNTGEDTLRILAFNLQDINAILTSAQVSLYPLRQRALAPAIHDALGVFRQFGLDVTVGSMSSLITGDSTGIFGALKRAFEHAAEQGEVVMATTLSNACPVPDRSAMNSISFRPIGVVKNEFSRPVDPDTLKAAVSRIVIDPELTTGLTGLTAGGKALVLFHLHESEGGELLQHPHGDRSLPHKGVFALRSPLRPNPIGVTEVELLAVEENVLTVRGLDAIDGTPVLDLKSA
jgi:tRNA-Thr(GGU) m(6)t(6)A37 methyltransferase TsaA